MNDVPVIKTRKEALEEGSKTFYTGVPCKHNHLSPRHTNGSVCESAISIDWKQYV